MLSNSHNFVRPKNIAERAYLESLIRGDYDNCRTGETFDDMKQRMSFSREDQGLYREWMAIAVARAKTIQHQDTLNQSGNSRRKAPA